MKLALALFVSLLAVPAASAAAAPPDRVVVLMSVDGLANFYLDDPKAEMPAIRKMIGGGVRAASMKASAPSVTWSNHATLVTGVHPARHGVVGNVFYDRAKRQPVVLLGDPVLDKNELLRVPTVYDAAKQAGLKTAAVRWPATRGAATIDWNIPDVGTVQSLVANTTPALRAELAEAGLWKPVEEAEKRAEKGTWLTPDDLNTDAACFILKRHRPNLLLLHLIDVDGTQHKHGPKSPEAYDAIKTADARVGRVLGVLEKEFAGKATVIVASDHGFSPIRRIILPNVVLRKAKLLNDGTGDGESSTPLVRAVAQGGCAMLYILDEAKRDETVKQIRAAFAGLEGVAMVVGPDETPKYGVARPADDPRAPDVLLFADLGYAFGDTVAGELPFEVKPERKGSHGHDPNLPELYASFVMWGAGVKPGAKVGAIENVAVTPTIAKLLGLEMPGLDGKPTSEALTTP